MMRVFTALPDLPSARHILNPERGWLSVVVPIARTNIVTNPSFETNTTNYTAVGASIARDTAQQYHSAYSLRLDFSGPSAANDGVYYGTVSLTSDTTYAFSLKFLDVRPNRPYKISFATTGGVDLATYRFRSTGKWQWIWVLYTETSTTTRRLYLTKDNSTHTLSAYTDGWQCEACESGNWFPTTYIDGDQQGLLPAGQFPPAYGWDGARHASTSYRTAQTRDGGQVKNLDLFKFFVTAIAGLGLATPSHIANEQSYTDGAAYQTSVVPSREIEIQGRFNTRSNVDLKQARKTLASALNLDATAPRQPIALLYQEHDGPEPTSDVGKIIASRGDGMRGQWDNLIGEDATITYTQWLPFIIGGDAGAAITTSESITISDANTLMRRDDNGDWSVLDSQPTNRVLSIARHFDGTYYVAGQFTTIGGTAANRIARYDPSTGTFSALGTGLAGGASPKGQVVRIAPNGDVYVGGAFTTANGVTVNNITRWNGTTFVALGSGATKGVDNTAIDLAFDSSGNVWVTGDFLNAGGSGANRVAKYTVATDAWSALGTGLNGGGTAIVVSRDDSLVYVSGSFTTANGVSANQIAAWNATTFVALGSGFAPVTRSAFGMQIALDGALYASGTWDSAGGVTARGVARWNGFGWQSLGTGPDNDAGEIEIGADGLVYIAGSAWTTVNGVPVSDSFAIWNGSAWILPDIEMPGAAGVQAIATSPRGGLLISFAGSSGTASAAQLNTLTNNGTAPTYPIATITGPSSSTARLYQIRNYTTNRTLSLNLLINTGEQITIRCSPFGTRVFSTFRGDISHLVIPGSATDFMLLPGANSVAFLATGSAITVTTAWPRQYHTTDDLTY